MSITIGPVFNAQNGKVREWSIVVSFYHANGTQIAIGSDDAVDQAVSDGDYATYHTHSGYQGMKMTTSAPTVVAAGKNLGKKNATNALSQALKESRSKYEAKLKTGYTVLETMDSDVLSAVPFPMAVKSWKDHKSKLVFPLFVQPKLDGVRMLASFDGTNVHLNTRRLRDISGFQQIKDELLKRFKAVWKDTNLHSLVIDGELYSHGVELQTISGIARGVSTSEELKDSLQYHVFDCFIVRQPLLAFPDRMGILTSFLESDSDKGDSGKIVLTPTVQMDSEAGATAYFEKKVAEGYEGIIYKSADKPYEFSFDKERRSSWYLKRKTQDDAEFPIVGFTTGKGKDSGCIVLELQGPNGKTFNCVPNGTYDSRKLLYQQALSAFDTDFKDKLAKVVYDDLSKDGIPLRGRVVQIGRDLAFD